VTPAEVADGWRLLFDGTSLRGWRGFRGKSPQRSWRVRDGVLSTVGKSGEDIVTLEDFWNRVPERSSWVTSERDARAQAHGHRMVTKWYVAALRAFCEKQARGSSSSRFAGWPPVLTFNHASRSRDDHR
jgi:hypothetical protein